MNMASDLGFAKPSLSSQWRRKCFDPLGFLRQSCGLFCQVAAVRPRPTTTRRPHHGHHAKAIKSEGTAAGISVITIIPAFGIDESNGQDDWTFLNTILKQ
jgi:hypothetical protein